MIKKTNIPNIYDPNEGYLAAINCMWFCGITGTEPQNYVYIHQTASIAIFCHDLFT
jgi:hypothetical protein